MVVIIIGAIIVGFIFMLYVCHKYDVFNEQKVDKKIRRKSTKRKKSTKS